MRATMFVILAACGGSGGSGGSFDATVDVDGTPSTFSESCTLTESDMFFDISATNGSGIAFEIKWKKALITMAGTYPTGGIVADISMFALKGDQILNGMGSVTFTTYTAPDEFVGTFQMTATGLMANGFFDCR